MCIESCCMFVEILISIVVPPLGVFLRHGLCSLEFLICLLLTFCGYVPGIIYAIYVIVAVDPEPNNCHDQEQYWQPIAR
ncbi:hypothetical protein Taro_045834 [Colocasia esculenta]|uniref:Uncharacterized protein n=1 Tax=Colocasia esculenta TaxID=4460 RepID=A0A843X6V6_COLES|nr:hypothetical protein [Colocasia esculenta]